MVSQQNIALLRDHQCHLSVVLMMWLISVGLQQAAGWHYLNSFRKDWSNVSHAKSDQTGISRSTSPQQHQHLWSRQLGKQTFILAMCCKIKRIIAAVASRIMLPPLFRLECLEVGILTFQLGNSNLQL